jgi:hypothetical protein
VPSTVVILFAGERARALDVGLDAGRFAAVRAVDGAHVAHGALASLDGRVVLLSHRVARRLRLQRKRGGGGGGGAGGRLLQRVKTQKIQLFLPTFAERDRTRLSQEC